MGRLLPETFYRRPGLQVARDLLGRVLCRRTPDGSVLRAPIVEVEAYDGPLDRAENSETRELARARADHIHGSLLRDGWTDVGEPRP